MRCSVHDGVTVSGVATPNINSRNAPSMQCADFDSNYDVTTFKCGFAGESNTNPTQHCMKTGSGRSTRCECQ